MVKRSSIFDNPVTAKETFVQPQFATGLLCNPSITHINKKKFFTKDVCEVGKYWPNKIHF